ncbi:MAG: UDP-3-O-(3-hydroxymyristoyl)glucosamine N-acyltransferase [Pseudomonadota bacterium]
MIPKRRFFDSKGPFSADQIAKLVGAQVATGDETFSLADVAALGSAGETDLSFAQGRHAEETLPSTRAAACLVTEDKLPFVPKTTIALVHARPDLAFANAIGHFYPEALKPVATYSTRSHPSDPPIHPTAILEDGVHIEPGAIIGEEARIGADTVVHAGAVIGRRVTLGRECSIGSGAVVAHAMLGDRVTLHSGVCLGQDGFGYVSGPEGHLKIPHIGTVVIQDNVEIGATTTIDRGMLDDTIVGEGTKIDNMVQIGHNVVIGRHCLIVSQVGISGSARLGDFVVIGGQSGVRDHARIGDFVRIAAVSTVSGEITEPGEYGGYVITQPAREWLRELFEIKKLVREARKARKTQRQ